MLESSIWDGVEQLISGIQRSSAPRRLLMFSINGEIIHSSPLLGGSIWKNAPHFNCMSHNLPLPL